MAENEDRLGSRSSLIPSWLIGVHFRRPARGSAGIPQEPDAIDRQARIVLRGVDDDKNRSPCPLQRHPVQCLGAAELYQGG